MRVGGGRGLGALVAVVTVSFAAGPAFAQSAVFQAGFHQALRWSQATDGVVTYRLKVPVGRAGDRVRLTFMAGDGSLTLHRVTIARLGGGSLTVAKFAGQDSVTVPSRQKATTDPISFSAGFNEEVFVSFEAQGYLSTSSITAFPGSHAWPGNHAATFPGPAGGAWYRAIGLSTIEVEAAPTRAFVALGDSITEGYVEGDTWTYSARNDDYRNAWPTVMQTKSGLPVANAAVSGQGLYDGLRFLDREVKSLTGITDCVVLLGTNDLGAPAGAQGIQDNLTTLINRLSGFCRVWMSTLLPKETTSGGATIVQQRHAVNAWIRGLTNIAGVIDLEAVTRDGANADRFKPAYVGDGIHPSIAGHAAMGAHAGDYFAAPSITAISPSSGTEAGGVKLTLSGVGFRPGMTVRFGGTAGTALSLAGPTSVTVTTPAHPPGNVLVEAVNADGTVARLSDGYFYSAELPTISECSPRTLPATVGGSVMLSGSNFRSGSRVLVDGVEASSVQVEGPSRLKFQLGSASAGAAIVKVLGPSGETAESNSCLMLIAGPSIIQINPSELLEGVAVRVTLKGADLSTARTLTVGGVEVVPMVVSDSELSAGLPALSAGNPAITVMNADGQSTTYNGLRIVSASKASNIPTGDDTGPGDSNVGSPAMAGCSAGSGPVGIGIVLMLAAFKRRRG